MAFSAWNVSSYKPDSLWSWFICLCSTLCMVLTIGFSFALGVLFPVLMDAFHETRERTACVSSIILGVCYASGPFTGALLNRYGVRFSTVMGCLLSSAGLAMGSFVNHTRIVILYIIFSLPFAFGASFIYVTSTVIASQYFVKRRSLALGLLTGGQGLGTMILGPALQALVDALDWRNTFRVLATALFILSFSGFLLSSGPSSSSEKKDNSSRKLRFNLTVLKNPRVFIRVALPSFFAFSRMIPYVHLVEHCRDLGIPAAKGSILYLFLGIFASLGRLGGGFLCNLKFFQAGVLFQVATFFMGASTVVMTLARSYIPMVVYAIVFSVSDGMMVTTFIIDLLNSVPEPKGASIFGFAMLGGGISALAGPPIAGLMADKSGQYVGAFLLAGGVGIISSVIPSFLLCFEDESNLDSKIELIEEAKEHNEGFATGHDEKLLLVSNVNGLDNNKLMVLSMARESDV
ncbi:monocarboxylate transporter 10-like isoform X1 [Montipora capricornis]|uniref:monocarboxylate transporter 10-like isoform X1 n=1 Tax=Montipora capricornis TaxID=246305 RepID=UPI0035F20F29